MICVKRAGLWLACLCLGAGVASAQQDSGEAAEPALAPAVETTEREASADKTPPDAAADETADGGADAAADETDDGTPDATADETAGEAAAKPGFGPGMTRPAGKDLDAPDFEISFAKYFASLAVILLLVVVFFYALRRFGRRVGVGGYGSLQVIARQQLDAKNTLVLTRVHDEEFLLAVGPNGTTLLTRCASLDDPATDADGALSGDGESGGEPAEPSSPAGLAARLSGLFNKAPLQPGGRQP
mgnify:FL=1